MHYILLSIALNLGKENIDLIKSSELNPIVNINIAQTEPENDN